MIDGVTLPKTLGISAEQLHPGYLGERVVISTDSGKSGVIGTLSSFKMATLPQVAGEAATFVKVKIAGKNYDIDPQWSIHFLELYNELPRP